MEGVTTLGASPKTNASTSDEVHAVGTGRWLIQLTWLMSLRFIRHRLPKRFARPYDD